MKNNQDDKTFNRGSDFVDKETTLLKEELLKERKEIHDQRTALFNILEDVTFSEASIKKQLQHVQVLSDTISQLSINITPRRVMENILNSISKLVSYYSISYIIWEGEVKIHQNLIYISTKGPINNNYKTIIKKDFLNFINKQPNTVTNKNSVIKQLSGKLYFEFLMGTFDDNTYITPNHNYVLPFYLEGGDIKNRTKYIMGLFHISTTNPHDTTIVENKEILENIARLTAINLDQIRKIAKTEQARLANLLRSLTNGVILFDNKKKILLSNPAAEKLLGLPSYDPTQENKVGNLPIERVTYDEIEKLLSSKDFNMSDRVTKLLEHGKESHLKEFWLLDFVYEVWLIPVTDLEANVIGGALVFYDITHRKEVDRMKTEFVSIASHQLRTPLTAIKLFTELLLNEKANVLGEKERSYLQNIYHSTNRMVRLVNDLLNVSRLETGRLKVEVQKINLVSFLEKIIEEVRPLAVSKKIKILFHKPKYEITDIQADHELLRQVIQNIISNAIRYTKAEAKMKDIEIDLTVDNMNIQISVLDHGIGIAKEHQAQITDKFFRADNAQLMEVEGSGLGLYVAHMVLEASGGELKFKSILGKGSTFYVTLPKKGMVAKEGEKGLS